MARKILFKGGTSLSKVFRLIERFSEDIDLVLDWTEVTQENPRAARSVSGQDAFNQELLRRAHVYLRETFLPEVRLLVDGVCEAAIEENPEVVKIKYPAAFPSDYLRAEIQLEVGPLAAWVPNAEYEIRSYAAEALPTVFHRPECRVRAIKAERTFWEKVTILHHEANRPENSPQPAGYSRHYYDVCRMAQTRVKTDAFADLDLLSAVAAFKDKFYHRGWARYDLAKPGTIKLVPHEHVRKAVVKDYEGMRMMIFGECPDFRDIVEQLRALEAEINTL
ncbi:MAG: nucleotidyl transferase AbiEii/AbiGii toxin family protein, partial [Verrucomicrobia bacterium]|nr:nucleotidyl transferase AbiEii/AbiGii toxin family protein [Verrucomicrobiota bacterium]